MAPYLGECCFDRTFNRLHPATEVLMSPSLVFFVVFATYIPTNATTQDYRVAFEGRPLKKVESSFELTTSRSLSADQSFEYSVRIVERQGRYYWASRGMKELTRSEGGAYITFHAVDGSGYVRVGAPMFLDLRDQLPEEQRRREIGYVEHLLSQFSSITYYGNRTKAR